MNDRELLELAAKAAGIKMDYNGYGKVPEEGSEARFIGDEIYFFSTKPGQGNVLWNPLTDDGDALRLAVKLELIPYQPTKEYPQAGCQNNDSTIDIYVPLGADPCAATRRAIVRAAAEIGRAA